MVQEARVNGDWSDGYLNNDGEDKPWWLKNSEDPRVRTQWVLFDVCGCARSVLEGSEASSPIRAMDQFFDGREELEEALKAGVTVRRMTHAEYDFKYAAQMRLDYVCPHEKKISFWRQFWNALTGKGW